MEGHDRAAAGAFPILQLGYGSVIDRKSTRLNSSHSQISYAVFCLKKPLTLPTEHDTLAPRSSRPASRGSPTSIIGGHTSFPPQSTPPASLIRSGYQPPRGYAART